MWLVVFPSALSGISDRELTFSNMLPGYGWHVEKLFLIQLMVCFYGSI